MKRWVSLCAVAALTLSGCRGSSNVMPSQFVPSQQTAATTAWGTVVDDPSGKPLGNVPVNVYPWKPCVKTSRTTRRCPRAIYKTKTKPNGRFNITGVGKGHYLLTIGSDDPADLKHPTIHDSIELAGTAQRLVAPTLPKIPAYQGIKAYKPPAPETSGNYRITTLDTREVACVKSYDYWRLKYDAQRIVSDEWLVENVRALSHNFYYLENATFSTGVVATGGWSASTPRRTMRCVSGIPTYFLNQAKYPMARDPRELWFGGSGASFRAKSGPKTQYFNLEEMPLDPRSGKYFGAPRWP